MIPLNKPISGENLALIINNRRPGHKPAGPSATGLHKLLVPVKPKRTPKQNRHRVPDVPLNSAGSVSTNLNFLLFSAAP